MINLNIENNYALDLQKQGKDEACTSENETVSNDGKSYVIILGYKLEIDLSKYKK